MGPNMKDYIILGKNMDEANLFGLMAQFILEISLKMIYMEMELMNELMGENILVGEKITKWKEEGNLHD